MGNRAVITTSTSKTGVGIYIHWNGGYESVAAFLDVCRERGYRDPSQDPEYAMAYLCGLLCEFFANGSSVGIGPLSSLDCDNHDNGVYVIGRNWEVVDRWGEGSEPVPTSMTLLSQQQLEKYRGIKQKLTKQE